MVQNPAVGNDVRNYVRADVMVQQPTLCPEIQMS